MDGKRIVRFEIDSTPEQIAAVTDNLIVEAIRNGSASSHCESLTKFSQKIGTNTTVEVEVGQNSYLVVSLVITKGDQQNHEYTVFGTITLNSDLRNLIDLEISEIKQT